MLNALYCLIGKSGTGKSTVMQALHDTYGYTIAQSYTDRAKRTSDEQGHVFLSPAEFDALSGLILPRSSQDGRYGMTEEMLDKSELIVLDYLGTQELLQTYTKRPVHVIGLHADTRTRIVRIDGRGNTFQERRKRLSSDEHEFYSMNDLCDIVVPNRDLKQTVGIIKNFIDFCEEAAWVCTDNDCLQFRRRVGVDSNKMPVYELVQVNGYGDDLFHVAHGRVYFSDVDEDELESLFNEYGWSYYSLLGEDGWGIVAEAVFENSATEYDTTEEYSTFEAAARALGKIIGQDSGRYL